MTSTPPTHQMLLESQMDPAQSEVRQTEQGYIIHIFTCAHMLNHKFTDTQSRKNQ